MMLTIKAIAALSLHTAARALHALSRAAKPQELYIPEDAPISFSTSPWFPIPNHNAVVLSDQDDPISAFSNHIVPLGCGLTVVTSTMSPHGDWSRVYVLITAQKNAWALWGRNEYGEIIDTQEVL